VTYLLDTDTHSNLLKRRPSTPLLNRLATTRAHDQFTSSIIVYGAMSADHRRDELLERIEHHLLPRTQLLIFDHDAAYQYGALRAYLEQRGTRLYDADLRIAAVALAQSLILVSGNIRHFQRVPNLQVENWLL
jgi:predicted nucleic acid-binding protein